MLSISGTKLTEIHSSCLATIATKSHISWLCEDLLWDMHGQAIGLGLATRYFVWIMQIYGT